MARRTSTCSTNTKATAPADAASDAPPLVFSSGGGGHEADFSTLLSCGHRVLDARDLFRRSGLGRHRNLLPYWHHVLHPDGYLPSLAWQLGNLRPSGTRSAQDPRHAETQKPQKAAGGCHCETRADRRSPQVSLTGGGGHGESRKARFAQREARALARLREVPVPRSAQQRRPVLLPERRVVPRAFRLERPGLRVAR